jgi:hypothetical protein
MEREKEKNREGWTGTADDKTVLPMHHHDVGRNEDGDANVSEGVGRGRKSIKGTLWVILAVATTLAARRILRSGFRESQPHVLFSR